MLLIRNSEELRAAEAEQTAKGKERFDRSIFIGCCSHTHGNREVLTEADAHLYFDFACRYYQHPEIMTIAEFGDHLDRQDAAGDF